MMSQTAYRKLPDRPRRMVRELQPPAWAMQLVGACPRESRLLDRVDGEHFSLITARITDAADATPAQFEQRTFEAYASIAQALDQPPCRHALRFWNHVPFITDPADA